MKLRIGMAVLALTLALPGLAGAHVTLQPKEAPAGSYVRLDVRVPNETDDAATEKVEVEFPEGFAGVLYEYVPGWSVDVQTEKLDEPVATDDAEITEQVKTVAWTADDDQATIQPGSFQDFGLSAKMPGGEAGSALTFPSIQTYDDGEVVRWIGAPDSDEPAPTVTLTGAVEDAHHAGAAPEEPGAPAAAPMAGHEGHIALAGVILGALGLLVALIALFRRR